MGTQLKFINSDEAREASPEQLFKDLNASPEGLSSEVAKQRLEQYGPNALEEKKVNPLLKFLGYFWGPIPWMIETIFFPAERERDRYRTGASAN